MVYQCCAGVVVGIVGGVLLRGAELSAEQIEMLGFAGEVMLRLLKMLVLPLVAGSMVAGTSLVVHKLLTSTIAHTSLNARTHLCP